MWQPLFSSSRMIITVDCTYSDIPGNIKYRVCRLARSQHSVMFKKVSEIMYPGKNKLNICTQPSSQGK